MKKILFISILIGVFSLSSCHIDPNFNSDSDILHSDSSDWMSLLDDNTRLADISIPGTHDSCSNYDFYSLSSTAAAQDLTISEQLEAGVRFFDLRPCKVNGTMQIMHGPASQHITLDEVIDKFINFLDNHSTEVILIALQPEYKDENDFSNIYNYFIDLKQDTEKSRYFVFAQDSSTLKLVDCRKKIVVLTRSSAKCTAMYDIFNENYIDDGVRYITTDVDETWNSFIEKISKKGGTSNTNLGAVFLSCYYQGQFGIPNIRIMSSALNKRLENYLSALDCTKHCLGIISCDHITENLAFMIYSRNELTP